MLEWKDPGLAVFPKPGRQDRALEKQLIAGGVPRANVVFLEDQAATKAAIEKALTEISARAGPDGTLLFYYAGHGVQETKGGVFFANYDLELKHIGSTALPLTRVQKILAASFKGPRLILSADCCYSGALAKVAAGFSKATGKDAVTLTSATASNVSTGNWTFTESLISILKGDGVPDSDGDGVLTLGEAGRFITTEMRFKESQRTSTFATAGFPPGFVLRDVDKTRVRKVLPGPYQASQYLEVEWKGDWYRAQILDAREREWQIHYLGYGPEFDEWVPAKRIREPAPITVKPGKSLDVEWKGTWWPAKVVEVDGDFAYIHYDGWGAEWDEWVTKARMR